MKWARNRLGPQQSTYFPVNRYEYLCAVYLKVLFHSIYLGYIIYLGDICTIPLCFVITFDCSMYSNFV